MKPLGRIFVISAPSGTGKTTVLACVRQRLANLFYSISYTTRPRRGGEQHRLDYHFVTEEVFQELIEADAFVEWAKVHGSFYGTPRAPIDEARARGQDVLLDIDVQGGQRMKAIFPDAMTVFLLPPDLEELKRRLSSRGTDTAEQIQVRLENAKREMTFQQQYDHCIINDDVEHACQQLCELIRGNESKRST